MALRRASDAAKDLCLCVPEGVSITGFDGLTVGVFAELDLTSVVQDGTEKGRLIARWGSPTGPAPQS